MVTISPHPEPYYSDPQVTLFHGDCRDILPTLGHFDAAVVDPPYGETSLAWDHWPQGWPSLIAKHTNSMWCFGSLRMFLTWRDEFADWKLSQDVIWEKHNGATFHADRFARVHETVTHWYRGTWADAHEAVPTTADAVKRTVRRKGRPAHTGHLEDSSYTSDDGGPRLMRSVIQHRSMHGRAIHPTEKPTGLLEPLVEYVCPVGGTLLDPFAGSGSLLHVAAMTGRTAVGIEGDEAHCEAAAKRLSQGSLFEGVV